jgi:hypothetical protein
MRVDETQMTPWLKGKKRTSYTLRLKAFSAVLKNFLGGGGKGKKSFPQRKNVGCQGLPKGGRYMKVRVHL